MTLSPPSFTFTSRHPKSPVFFHNGIRTYRFCLDCLRHHETRFCSGKTEISYEVCDVHKKNQHYWDLDDLKHFRSELRNGNMENGFHYKRPEVKIEAGVSNEDSPSQGSIAPDTTHVLGIASRSKYAAYDTQASHPNSPNGIFGNTFGQTRNGLRQQYYRASQEPLNPLLFPGKPRAMTELQKYLTWPFPAPAIRYAHDAEEGCIYSSSPNLVVLPRAVIAKINGEKYERMRVYREEYDANWGNLPEVKVEHGRLLEEVGVGKLAKGVFVKRCNGVYVNGLGEIGQPDMVSDEWGRLRGEARVESRVMRESKRTDSGADSGYQGSEEASEGSDVTAVKDEDSAQKKLFGDLTVGNAGDAESRTIDAAAAVNVQMGLYSNKTKATTTDSTVETDAKSESNSQGSAHGDETLPLFILQALEHAIATNPDARNTDNNLIQRCWCHKNMLPLDSTYHTDPAAWYGKTAREREWECKRWVVFKD